jgi:hypothetical protein
VDGAAMRGDFPCPKRVLDEDLFSFTSTSVAPPTTTTTASELCQTLLKLQVVIQGHIGNRVGGPTAEPTPIAAFPAITLRRWQNFHLRID